MFNLENTLKNIFLLLGAFFVILILFITHLMSSFLVPIFIAFFIAFLLQPMIKRLQKFNIPIWLATVIVISMAILIISTFLFILLLYSKQFLYDIQSYSKEFQKNSLAIIDMFGELEIVRNIINSEKLKTMIFEFAAKINYSAAMINTMTKTLNLIKDFFYIIIALIFILPGMNRISIRISKAFPEKSAKINKIIFNITEQIQKYIFVKSIISLLIGSIVTITCFIFGIKYAFLWGFITFLFHFIPYLGAFTSVILIVTFSFIQYQSVVLTLILLAIISTAYVICSEIIEPNFQSEGVNLSPIIIFTSLFIWGYIWGIAGVFLAVPIMSAFNVICENIEVLKPINRLIGSRKRTKKKKKYDF